MRGASLRGAPKSPSHRAEGAEPALGEHPGFLLQVQRPLLRQDGEAGAADQPRHSTPSRAGAQRAEGVFDPGGRGLRAVGGPCDRSLRGEAAVVGRPLHQHAALPAAEQDQLHRAGGGAGAHRHVSPVSREVHLGDRAHVRHHEPAR